MTRIGCFHYAAGAVLTTPATPAVRAILAAAMAAAALSLMGCIGDSGGESAIAAHRAQWRKQEPEAYSYTVTRNCHCLGGPIRVIASRDSALSVSELRELTVFPLPEGAPLDKREYSIEALFDQVESMVGRRHTSHSLSFDGTYGYPDSFAYDESETMADDEYGLTISDFTVLP
jgi:hypothetical protein